MIVIGPAPRSGWWWYHPSLGKRAPLRSCGPLIPTIRDARIQLADRIPCKVTMQRIGYDGSVHEVRTIELKSKARRIP